MFKPCVLFFCLTFFSYLGNYMKRQISIWSAQYDASKTGSVPQMDYLMDWLPKNLPEDEKSTIVHGDFRYYFLNINQ